jgi:two-component SAPR family response regulator
LFRLPFRNYQKPQEHPPVHQRQLVKVLVHLIRSLYDLLILDVKMDKMNGLELYREIKKIDNKVKVCFLAASKYNYEAFADVLIDLKENQFIQKPIQNKDLIKIIDEIIN